MKSSQGGMSGRLLKFITEFTVKIDQVKLDLKDIESNVTELQNYSEIQVDNVSALLIAFEGVAQSTNHFESEMEIMRKALDASRDILLKNTGSIRVEVNSLESMNRDLENSLQKVVNSNDVSVNA